MALIDDLELRTLARRTPEATPEPGSLLLPIAAGVAGLLIGFGLKLAWDALRRTRSDVSEERPPRADVTPLGAAPRPTRDVTRPSASSETSSKTSSKTSTSIQNVPAGAEMPDEEGAPPVIRTVRRVDESELAHVFDGDVVEPLRFDQLERPAGKQGSGERDADDTDADASVPLSLTGPQS